MLIKSRINRVFLISSFLLTLPQLTLAKESFKKCSREWAQDGSTQKSFKIIGLGLSSEADLKTAVNEARNEAFKDILLQLQINIETQTETQESQSFSKATARSLLTSKLEGLKGIKPIKTGKNLDENISHCEAYEFNVQSSYQDLSSKFNPIFDLAEKINQDTTNKKWLNVIQQVAQFKAEGLKAQPDLQKADVFKAVIHIPGPTWDERFTKAASATKEADEKARDHIFFIFPQDQFEAPIAEIEGRLTNSGIKTLSSEKDLPADAEGIAVSIRTLGKPIEAKTHLGLTVTRKVAIQLNNIRTKKKLAANNSLAIIGASQSNNLEEAIGNSDSQLIRALTDSIQNISPELIREQ